MMNYNFFLIDFVPMASFESQICFIKLLDGRTFSAAPIFFK